MVEYLSLTLNVILIIQTAVQAGIILGFWKRQGFISTPSVPQIPIIKGLTDKLDLTGYSSLKPDDDEPSGADEAPIW